MIWLAVVSALAGAPAPLKSFVAQLRSAAAAHDLRAVSRLVDREFTTGEELGRADSIDELRGKPALLDKLVDVIDHGHCEVDADHVQCDRFVPTAPKYDHGSIAIFGKVHTQWRMLAFYPAP